jgi:hypothetical protein
MTEPHIDAAGRARAGAVAGGAARIRNLADLATVRAATGIDVTAGEYGYDLPYFARMVGSIDCLVPHQAKRMAGGIAEDPKRAVLVRVGNSHGAQGQHLLLGGVHVRDPDVDVRLLRPGRIGKPGRLMSRGGLE